MFKWQLLEFWRLNIFIFKKKARIEEDNIQKVGFFLWLSIQSQWMWPTVDWLRNQSLFPSCPLAVKDSLRHSFCLCQALLFRLANRTMSTMKTQDRAYMATPPHLIKNLGLGETSSQYSIVPPTKIRIVTNSSTNRTSTTSPSRVPYRPVCLRNQRACRRGLVISLPKRTAQDSMPDSPSHRVNRIPRMLMVWWASITGPSVRKYTHQAMSKIK